MAQPRGDDRPNIRAGAIGGGVGARRRDRDWVDVAACDALMKNQRAGDRQNPGAGSDIENPRLAPALGDSVERLETAERCAVMAGAEGERRLDFDADVVGAPPPPVMRAMDQHPAGAHRGEAGQRILDPVLLGDGRKAGGPRNVGARG